jgi:hypothetical protein
MFDKCTFFYDAECCKPYDRLCPFRNGKYVEKARMELIDNIVEAARDFKDMEVTQVEDDPGFLVVKVKDAIELIVRVESVWE